MTKHEINNRKTIIDFAKIYLSTADINVSAKMNTEEKMDKGFFISQSYNVFKIGQYGKQTFVFSIARESEIGELLPSESRHAEMFSAITLEFPPFKKITISENNAEFCKLNRFYNSVEKKCKENQVPLKKQIMK